MAQLYYNLGMINKRFLLALFIIFCLFGTSAIITFLARGYQIDLKKKEITGTGIISVTSIPDGALIFLDDKPAGATNTSLTGLAPGKYGLHLEKQGFANWQKEVAVEKELVTKVEAVLVLSVPEFKPLTFTEAENPLLSPDCQKIIYTAVSEGIGGIWLLDLSERPFNLANKPSLVLKDQAEYEYSKGSLSFSPDSKSILIESKENFSLDLVTRNVSTIENATTLKSTWEKELQFQEQKLLEGANEELAGRIATLPSLLWSPDNTKIIFENKTEQKKEFKSIDLKKAAEGKEVETTVYTAPIEQFTKLVWYPDSKHLLILEKESLEAESGKISLIELDGENKMQIFSGTIVSDYLFPYPNGSKVVILTTFNPESKQYNLYSINLR